MFGSQRFAPRRRGWLVVLGVVLAAGTTAAFLAFGRDADPAGAQFDVAPIARGDLAAKVTATGKLSALVTVEVGSQVSGRVRRILVDYNSPVEKGQLLAEIDPRLFQAALEQARAGHQAARAGLAKAQAQAADAERTRRRVLALAEKRLVSEADVDKAQTDHEAAAADVEVARANLAQAEASLHQAELNLTYTAIVSPIGGVVISRSVDVGQTVAAAFQAPVLFTIAEDLRRMQVDTNVAEADVGRLRPDMAAYFTVDAYPYARFAGVVRQIRNAAQTTQNVVTYDAVIDVENDDLRLKPGMTASVTFVCDQRENVLRAPNAALRFRPPGGPPAATAAGDLSDPTHRTVWVLQDGSPQPRRVTLGISDGAYTEVSGEELREGEPVITGLAGGSAAANAARKRQSGPGGGPPPPF